MSTSLASELCETRYSKSKDVFVTEAERAVGPTRNQGFVGSIRQAWERGDLPNAELLNHLETSARLSSDWKQLGEFVLDILTAPVDRDVDVWSAAVLERAEILEPVFRQNFDLHEQLMFELFQKALDDFEGDRLFDLAFAAIGKLGSWPFDTDEDVFLEIEDEPTELRSLRFYRAYLDMAGLSDDDIGREMNQVLHGQVAPSRGRIEMLRSNRNLGTDEPRR